MLTVNYQTAKQKIITYFEGAGLDYCYWDKAFNMHFGYYNWGMNPLNLPALLNQMNQEALNRLHLDGYENPLVLDLGCGLGATSRYMAMANAESQFCGFTITPWQVKYGNQLSKAAGLDDRVQLYESDFAHLPLGNESADAAFALESACYAKGDGKGEFVKELHRVLKPGGRFVIADGFRKHSNPLPGWLNRVYRKNMECWALSDLADVQLFTAELKKAGFCNLRIEDASWRVAPSFAHIPFVTLRFYWDIWQKNENTKLDQSRKNNVIAPLMGMIMGLSRKHFGYYIISGEKPA